MCVLFWTQVLFLFGYAPATHAALQKRIDVEVAKFKAAKTEASKAK